MCRSPIPGLRLPKWIERPSAILHPRTDQGPTRTKILVRRTTASAYIGHSCMRMGNSTANAGHSTHGASTDECRIRKCPRSGPTSAGSPFPRNGGHAPWDAPGSGTAHLHRRTPWIPKTHSCAHGGPDAACEGIPGRSGPLGRRGPVVHATENGGQDAAPTPRLGARSRCHHRASRE